MLNRLSLPFYFADNLNMKKKFRVTYNAPVTLTFAIMCVVILLLNDFLLGKHLIPAIFTAPGRIGSNGGFNYKSVHRYNTDHRCNPNQYFCNGELGNTRNMWLCTSNLCNCNSRCDANLVRCWHVDLWTYSTVLYQSIWGNGKILIFSNNSKD